MITPTAAHRHKGFTLVETLVALVVMAVGMLGIAALYVEGLRANRTAIYRTNAIVLAADMADRIRANPAGGLTYAGAAEPSGEPAPDCSAGCDAQQLVSYDWTQWLDDIDQRLPNGANAEISAVRDDTVSDGLTLYTIALNWPEAGQEANVRYELAFQR